MKGLFHDMRGIPSINPKMVNGLLRHLVGNNKKYCPKHYPVYIHAARRNIDLTAIVMNNRVYGMTGGQFSSLSGPGVKATTAPYQSIDNSFDIVELATAAGVSFVIRSTAYHVKDTTELLKKAIRHKGFSVMEILSQCPTHYSRKNKEGDAVSMLEIQKNTTAKLDSKELKENPGLIPDGFLSSKNALNKDFLTMNNTAFELGLVLGS